MWNFNTLNIFIFNIRIKDITLKCIIWQAKEADGSITDFHLYSAPQNLVPHTHSQLCNNPALWQLLLLCPQAQKIMSIFSPCLLPYPFLYPNPQLQKEFPGNPKPLRPGNPIGCLQPFTSPSSSPCPITLSHHHLCINPLILPPLLSVPCTVNHTDLCQTSSTFPPCPSTQIHKAFPRTLPEIFAKGAKGKATEAIKLQISLSSPPNPNLLSHFQLCSRICVVDIAHYICTRQILMEHSAFLPVVDLHSPTTF